MSDSKPKSLWLERTGKGSYVGYSSEGPSVRIGHGEGEFTPGDLLKLALAGCNATSSDARFSAALGDDYQASIGVGSQYDQDTNRFTHMDVEIVTDLSDLSDQERERLEQRATAAIDRHCTVGHTLTNGMTTRVVISSEF
ncbi:MAG: OsmC family protein [Actinomycetaceae bacterium]|nr:OsmC family protein [Actinomycetaceae bacterium]